MAVITITTPGTQDAEAAQVFGVYLGLKDANGDPRSATLAEIKNLLIIPHLMTTFRETKQAMVAATAKAAVNDISPT